MTQQRKAIYPGTFDPITLGHLDIVERAAQCFPAVVVAVSQHPDKAPLFPLEDRVRMVTEAVAHLPAVTVEPFEGLTVDLASRLGASILIKGIRSGADFDYERQMAHMNRSLRSVETLFLVASPEVSFISSTLVKEVARFGGSIDAYVPADVARMVKETIRGGA